MKYIIITYVKENDSIIFADLIKGRHFVENCIPKKDLTNGNIVVTYA